MSNSGIKIPDREHYQFLARGGEMGALTRAKDWSQTPVGPVEEWPQSLRTTLGIILNSKFPMFLWWGPELICFYNDAYRPSLGQDGKHPSILGMPAKAAWPEIWTIIKPLIDQVLNDGEATWSEDQLIPIYRNGKIEDVYWTFSYSPVKDESGKTAGVLVTCCETTDKVITYKKLAESKVQLQFENAQLVLARQKIEEADKRFRNTVKQAPIGITILRGPRFIVEMANDPYLELVDRKEAAFVGRPLFDSLPEVEGTVHVLLDNVLETGTPFHGIEYPIPVNRYGKYETSYFDFLYYPLKEDDGTISGIIVTVTDVTESVKAKHSITESERQFRNMVMQSPIPMAILRGKDYVIEMANMTMFADIWRRTEKDVLGKKLLEAFPELKEQKFPDLLNDVYITGKTYREFEAAAFVQGDDGIRKFYFDFEYSPLFETDGSVSGIMITVNNVTEKVEARKKIEENEERLNIIIDASQLGTWELNLKTDEIIYSERHLEIFGHKQNASIGHVNFMKQIHPDDRSIRDNAVKNAMENGELDYEIRLIWEDGSIHWIDAKGKVFYDESNQPAKIIGTIRDITEEKYYEQELQEREQKFRLLADSMPQHIWTADLEGKLNYFNRSVIDYSGLTPEQLTKEGWLQIVHPDDREGNIEHWINAITTGKDFLFEHRFRRHDGEYRWQLSRAIPQKDADGKIQMWVGTSTDIQDIKELDQQKDYFISMASHELKTPITSIKGYAQMLQGMYLNSEDVFLKNSLKVIDKQIQKLTHLISDLLDVSKIKSGNLVLVRESFPINELIREVIVDMANIYPDFDFVFSEEAEIILNADRERISQVLINLFTNAIKYSPVSRVIKVRSIVKDNTVMIYVEDSGIGISKKDQEKIFERFYRVEGKSEKTFPGFGIGLFISAEIVQRHGGKIGVESEPGKGSTFYFSLGLDNHMS